jgi:hypothetical protein
VILLGWYNNTTLLGGIIGSIDDNSGLLGIILSIISILISLIIILVEHKTRYLRNKYLAFKMFIKRPKLIERGYYSHDFVKTKIETARENIRVICVRNMRITEPDICEEIKKFVLERNGSIEILALSPKASDEVICEIMPALPRNPCNPEQFRDEVITNRKCIFDLQHTLGERGNKLSYFEYKTLPLMHMFQVDDTIYLGFQLYHKEQVGGSLLDYCIEIHAHSDLGKKILDQFRYIQENKSEKATENGVE